MAGIANQNCYSAHTLLALLLIQEAFRELISLSGNTAASLLWLKIFYRNAHQLGLVIHDMKHLLFDEHYDEYRDLSSVKNFTIYMFPPFSPIKLNDLTHFQNESIYFCIFE